jgi:hypothetical protein
MPHKPHPHDYFDDPPTPTGVRVKRSIWKWLIGGGGAVLILTAILCFPILESCATRGRAIYRAQEIEEHLDFVDTNLMGHIDTLQYKQWEEKAWQEKTDERLDDIEKQLDRILDNQEKTRTPKMKDKEP